MEKDADLEYSGVCVIIYCRSMLQLFRVEIIVCDGDRKYKSAEINIINIIILYIKKLGLPWWRSG